MLGAYSLRLHIRFETKDDEMCLGIGFVGLATRAPYHKHVIWPLRAWQVGLGVSPVREQLEVAMCHRTISLLCFSI